MSLLLGMAFAALGLLALVAISASLRQSAPLVTELRSALSQPLPPEELRLAIHDAALSEAEPIPVRPHPLRQPKPIARLLLAREPIAEFS